ncbi:MAG: hypothetical protein BWX80_02433 [Candidatus Hydrogenedentes bacterium ADurb.Bin101]|nr:MAG: hypothetical protein BWX80_02433 [Candidatus Hydrogenedentes bacterium ADurb.Bin101]
MGVGLFSEIERLDGKFEAFASQPHENEKTVFGGGPDSGDITDNMTPEYRRGWGIVGVNDAPTMQDFNALGFLTTQVLAYLHQVGVPHWHTAQGYQQGALAIYDGDLWQARSATINQPPPPENPADWVRLSKSPLTGDIEVFVGPNEDFATINEALEFLVGRYYPTYKSGGVTATIKLTEGFVMAEQVVVKGVDLGWITITAIDPVTTIDTAGLVDDYPVGSGAKAAFSGLSGAVLPNIGVLFAMGAAGADDYPGILLYEYARATVLFGAGVQNAKGSGMMIMNGSSAIADNAIFSGASGHGIQLENGRVWAREADCSNAGENGIQAEGRSTVQASEADCSNAGKVGIYARDASIIAADRAICEGCAEWGVLAQGASTINCSGVVARNCGSPGVAGGIGALGGSTVNAENADCSGCVGQNAVLANYGSMVNARNANLSGSSGRGVGVFGGSTVNAQGADCSGAAGDGILVSGGSTVNAQGADCSGAAGDGIALFGGSTVNAHGATGTTSATPNTLTAAGIIFK